MLISLSYPLPLTNAPWFCQHRLWCCHINYLLTYLTYLLLTYFNLTVLTNLNCAVPRTKTRLGDRSFVVAGPQLWNNLPVELQQRDICLSDFRRLLKTFLFCWDSAPCDFLFKCATYKYTYLLTYLTAQRVKIHTVKTELNYRHQRNELQQIVYECQVVSRLETECRHERQPQLLVGRSTTWITYNKSDEWI